MASVDALGNTPGTITDRYIALAIQGDLKRAQDMLQGIEAEGSERPFELAQRFRQRFVERTEPLSPGTGIAPLDRIVAAYRDYWVRSLLAGLPQTENDAALGQVLQQILQGVAEDGDQQNTFRMLEKAVGGLGFGVLAVPARPLQDLFIWGSQQDREFTVVLSDHTRLVRVAFLGDFVSQGWKEYASLGLATTTGWVEGGVLYCVEQSYIPGTERFEVSYLKHESRHLADLERYPNLKSADLEYRAKLTELAFASSTLRTLLDDFTAKSAPNPDSPHAVANLRVTRDLYFELHARPLPEDRGAWLSVSSGAVNAAARRLLRRNSEALESLSSAAME